MKICTNLLWSVRVNNESIDINNIFIAFRCTDGYMGSRCEYKDLDGSYLRKFLYIYDCIQSIYVFKQ